MAAQRMVLYVEEDITILTKEMNLKSIVQSSNGLKHAKLHQALVQNKSDIKPASVIYTHR